MFKSNSGFAALPEPVRNDFLNGIVFKQFKKRQNIFTEGTFPSGIYFIKRGKVKKFKTLNGGKEQIIYLCNEGELLGYAALLSEEPYPDSATALTDASIGFMPKEKLNELLETHPALSKMLMKNLSHEFGVLVNFIAAFTQKSVRERVALTLLILHEKFKENLSENDEVEIELSREDCANIVGTAVETLVRLLHDFKDENLIITRGRKIIITNKTQLVEIAHVADTF